MVEVILRGQTESVQSTHRLPVSYQRVVKVLWLWEKQMWCPLELGGNCLGIRSETLSLSGVVGVL